ncbi:MAG: hypothetical protein ACRDOG_12425 [Gaiellaceae bacterium]
MPQTTRTNPTIGMPSRVLVELGRVPVLEQPGRSLPPLRRIGEGRTIRRIGTIGTASRVLVGLGLLYLALADGGSWGLAWHEAVLGLVAFPAVMVALGFGARLLGVGPVRFDGPVGIAANTAVIVALVLIDYTASAAALFYGATLLVAVWRAQPGCEATVLSNWILGRDDQIGCPTFTPIDEAEARLARQSQREATIQPVAAEEQRPESLGDFGIAHIAACCGVGAAALVAITLVALLN